VRTIESKRGPQAWLELTVHEGRNRQVRRMCDAIGHPVDRLRRIQIGGVADDELKPGQVRDLRPDEIRKLTRSTDAAAAPARRQPPARRPKPDPAR
jgi:23S rRNA pseudouridine2605 synthase